MDETDIAHLRRCLVLARAARESGNEPFGSLLVDGDGTVVAERMNTVGSGDVTGHPELALAAWASAHLTAAQCAVATLYTSCESCAMCAAAHDWAGIGRLVFALAGEQLAEIVPADGPRVLSACPAARCSPAATCRSRSKAPSPSWRTTRSGSSTGSWFGFAGRDTGVTTRVPSNSGGTHDHGPARPLPAASEWTLARWPAPPEAGRPDAVRRVGRSHADEPHARHPALLRRRRPAARTSRRRPRNPPELLGDDPVADFDQARTTTLEHVRRSRASSRRPGRRSASPFSDQLLHGWDLATGDRPGHDDARGLAEAAYEMIHGRFTDEQRKGVFKPE